MIHNNMDSRTKAPDAPINHFFNTIYFPFVYQMKLVC